MYDILIKGGHVIDPKNGVDAKMDVGISASSIAAVQADIPESQGRKVVDASDCYVTPGLIDLHAHCYLYDGAMFPDELCFPYGVTTMVDCGGSGWRTFDHFNETVIRKAGPRVFALLNIVGHGMCGNGEQDIEDMDVELTAAKIRQRSDVIVGVKVAHYGGVGWESVDRGVAAAAEAGVFCLVDQNARASRPFRRDDAGAHEPGRWCHALLRVRQADDRQRWEGEAALLGGARQGHHHGCRARQQQLLVLDGGSGDRAGVPARHDIDRLASYEPAHLAGYADGSDEQVPRHRYVDVRRSGEVDLDAAQQIGHPELGTLTPGATADVTVLEYVERPCGLSDSGPTGYRIMPAPGRLINQVTIKGGAIQVRLRRSVERKTGRRRRGRI